MWRFTTQDSFAGLAGCHAVPRELCGSSWRARWYAIICLCIVASSRANASYHSEQ